MDKKLRPIKQRVVDFIDNQSIKKENFYKKTLLSPSNFKGEGLKSELGGENIAKILIAYPELDARWLITGEGEMLDREDQMMVGAGSEVTPAQMQVLKDEIMDLQRKLINCHEQKDNLVTGYLPLNMKDVVMKEEKVE